ncbi:Clavaminate synthase-like protein [Obba rivulosa]|uniref:Clavaminate synthase-like protein n=1 Tax=Obba rivulosa TaxID=1052685 RepID=A0A8E2AYR8_9APHY|nr:Clavaminate synthase-like protein [Obba rivulosa]
MSKSTGPALACLRRAYTKGCILQALADALDCFYNGAQTSALSSIRWLDKAIIIAGAPGEGKLDLILDTIGNVQADFLGRGAEEVVAGLPPEPPQRLTTTLGSMKTAVNSIPRLGRPPSLASFVSHMAQQPFILSGFIQDWPALNEHPWRSPRYLRSIAGPGRIVPVEIGDDYRKDEWTQALMPWDEFLDKVMPSPKSTQASDLPVLYLAQHNLFLQFPALQSDVIVPDYVYSSLPPPPDFPHYEPPTNADQLVMNAWLGPASTVSPAHTDPFYNFYAQAVGRKTVWLAPPDVGPSMYPFPPPGTAADRPHNPAANHTNASMSNTSQVDVFSSPDGDGTAHRPFPLFWENVVDRAMCATLEPGDLLFFPPGWWHAMRSEEVSFSVSMWF